MAQTGRGKLRSLGFILRARSHQWKILRKRKKKPFRLAILAILGE